METRNDTNFKVFARYEFYIKPPSERATKKEWKLWAKANKRKASAHEAKFEESMEYAETENEF